MLNAGALVRTSENIGPTLRATRMVVLRLVYCVLYVEDNFHSHMHAINEHEKIPRRIASTLAVNSERLWYTYAAYGELDLPREL